MKTLSLVIAAITLLTFLSLLATQSLEWKSIGNNVAAGGLWAFVTVTLVRWVTDQEQKGFVHALSFGAVVRLDLFAIRAANLLTADEPDMHSVGWPQEGIWKSVHKQIQRIPEYYSGVLPGEALVLLQSLDNAVAALIATSVDERRQYAESLAHVLLVSIRFAEKCLPMRGNLKQWTKDARKARHALMNQFKLDPDPWDLRHR